MLLTPPNKLLIAHLLPRFHGDKGLGPFAPLFIGHGRDTAFEDVGMGHDDGFQGYGGDIFAAWGVEGISIGKKHG